MRVLLLGAGGMLARDLLATKPHGVDLAARTHAETDITDAQAVRIAVQETRPDVIVNCAAYTQVDRAEEEIEVTFAVNAKGPGLVARAALQAGLDPLVVHYSTDYVFDGRSRRPYREGDPPAPTGTYGASKLAGEEALRASGARHLIIRTQWLFGLEGRSFPRTMWERARKRLATRVVNDQVGRPTYTADLARATWHLLAGQPGAPLGERPCLLHVANQGQATWYELARHVFAAAGVPELLQPCTTADYPTPAARPAYSVLDTSAYERLTGRSLPHWEDAVERFLAQLATREPA